MRNHQADRAAVSKYNLPHTSFKASLCAQMPDASRYSWSGGGLDRLLLQRGEVGNNVTAPPIIMSALSNLACMDMLLAAPWCHTNGVHIDPVCSASM